MTDTMFTGRLQMALSIGLICFGFTVPTTASAKPLSCPAPQKINGPGVLKETPVQIKEMTSFLSSGDVDNHMAEIVADLRKRYPGVQNAELENYLVTSYCPVVAKLNGLSEADQRSRVDRFAHQASTVIYGH